jgi:hypothetical protein
VIWTTLFSCQGAVLPRVIIRSAGLQFGLQFTLIQPGSPEYTHPTRPAAGTATNSGEPAPLKLLIRWFGIRALDGYGTRMSRNVTW